MAHAALVCETVTGKPYDQFAIEALFTPIGIEQWWFQFYEGGEGVGRHPSHGLGIPGSGGQYIAFVPSLDLFVTRQTGGSGEWPFEEYLRRACQACSE